MNQEEIVTGTNTAIEKIKVQITNALKKIGAISIIVMAIGSGFVIGYYYNTLFSKIKETDKVQHIYSTEEVSVYLGGGGQMLIMDNKKGEAKIYGKGVFDEIGKLWAIKLKEDVTKTQ